MPGSLLVDEHDESYSPSSSISIWLDNHPDHPEEYFCEIQPTLYQAESKKSPASPLRLPVPAAKRRKLVELSNNSMNARPQRTRRTSPRKDAREAHSNRSSASQEVDKDEKTTEARGVAPSTPIASPTRPVLLDQDTTPKSPSLMAIPHPNLSYNIPKPAKSSDSRSEASSPTRSTTSSSRASSTRSVPRARSP
jgi:hypothetical protein